MVTAGEIVDGRTGNPVYPGKIAHGDDLHDGKHEAIVDQSDFASAQTLLDERAAQSTTIRPTTSEYLLWKASLP